MVFHDAWLVAVAINLLIIIISSWKFWNLNDLSDREISMSLSMITAMVNLSIATVAFAIYLG